MAEGARRVADSFRTSTSVKRAARAGLAARGFFYLLLCYLVFRVALLDGAHDQLNANGALALIARPVLGKIAVALAALGFFAFGVERITAALTDKRPAWWRRATTGLQGLFYLAVAWVPISFLVSSKSTGSEQQQHKHAAELLGIPGGQELIVAVGIVIITVCCWQLRTAATRDYTDGMRLRGKPGWLRKVVKVVGTVGIAARAMIFLPIGIFLIVSAVTYDPARADGLDGELLALAHHSWGLAVLGVVALSLLVFAAYSFLEAAYRDVASGK